MPTSGIEEYPVEIIRNHIIVRLGDGRALIDTGSPMCIGRGRAFSLEGRMWQPGTESESVLDTIRDQLGVDIDWLLGYDVLNAHRILIDWQRGVATFGVDAVGANHQVPIEMVMNVPVIAATHNGRTVRAVLDSGAALSYAPPAAVVGAQKDEPYTDFYPGAGAFDTETWRVPICVGGRELQARVGILPDMLRLLFGLLLGEDGWIVGSDFFRDRAILIDYSSRRVVDVSAAREDY